MKATDPNGEGDVLILGVFFNRSFCRLTLPSRFACVARLFPALLALLCIIPVFFVITHRMAQYSAYLGIIESIYLSLMVSLIVSYGCASYFCLVAPVMRSKLFGVRGEVRVISWLYYDVTIVMIVVVSAAWAFKIL